LWSTPGFIFQAIFKEEMEGREVSIDLRSLSEKDWLQDPIAQGQRDMLMKHFSAGVKPLRISPMCHFLWGECRSIKTGERELPDSTPAGEIVGGVHGANRMGGNALSEILVFGNRAGKRPGRGRWNKVGWRVLRIYSVGVWMLSKRNGKTSRRCGSKANPEGDRPDSLGKRGIIREESGMTSALNALEKIGQEDLPGARAKARKNSLRKWKRKMPFSWRK